jgi:hypothetical protein
LKKRKLNKGDKMTYFKTSRLFIKTVMIVFCVAFLAVGCSENPIADTTQNPTPQVLTRSAASTSAMLSTAQFYTEAVISAEEGGQLVLLDVVLDIPAGAVANDTTFSINIPDITVFYNEFGTNGLEFGVPVTVTMSYRGANLAGIDESTIRIGWFNQRSGAFEDVECQVDFERQVVVAQLNHFSAYALISDEQ